MSRLLAALVALSPCAALADPTYYERADGSTPTWFLLLFIGAGWVWWMLDRARDEADELARRREKRRRA